MIVKTLFLAALPAIISSILLLNVSLAFSDESIAHNLKNEIQQDPTPFLFVEAATVGNKTFYAELLSLTNWTEAHHFCISQGMFVATVDTEEEKIALREFFTESGVPEWSDSTEANKRESEFWSAGVDLGTAGKYYWIDTGRPINDSTVVGGQITCERAPCIPGSCRCGDGSSCRDDSFMCGCNGQCACRKACSGHCVATVHYSTTTTQLRSLMCGKKVKLLCHKYNN